jgi:hypothetical protein
VLDHVGGGAAGPAEEELAFEQGAVEGTAGELGGGVRGHGGELTEEGGSEAVHHGRRVSIVSHADLKGGQVRRAVQVLGIGLMAAGLLLDASRRSRNRRAGRTSDDDRSSRLPLVLFWIGAVLLVLASI